MDVAIAQAKEAKGVKEGQAPLSYMVRRYHTYTGSDIRKDRNGNILVNDRAKWRGTTAWCASFASWCLGQVFDDLGTNKNPETPSSQAFIDHSTLDTIAEPIYGAIAVWTDCYQNGNPKPNKHGNYSGHVGFVYGKVKDKEGFYYILGGNQSNKICIVPSNCTGNVYKTKYGWRKFSGFFLPVNYNKTEADDLQETDIYKNSAVANTRLMDISLNTTANESTL
jgi:uncharacterized protein (TIGR02594 family)